MQAAEGTKKQDLHAAVEAVANAIHSGRLGPGQLAELRRIPPTGIPPAAFWHVLARLVEPYHGAPGTEPYRTQWEKRWATVMAGMALLRHDRERHPGQVLAEAGFHELRLRRLLRASEDRLANELLGAIRFLSSRGASVDWRELARLVHYDPARTPEWAEPVRRRLARNYFGAITS
jgi:CRISPR type I-E-associated protein CasB/Cse2